MWLNLVRCWQIHSSLGHIHFSYALSLSGGHQIRCGLQHLQSVAIKVTTGYGDTFWVRKCILLLLHELHYFGGKFFFISSSMLRNTQNGFLIQNFQHNSCYLSNDNVFSTNFYVFTHLCLFE
jgi:hypothetical protein